MPTVTESSLPTYRLTEEQTLLRDAVRTLADERVAPRAADIDRTGEFPEDLRQLLAGQDILALPFPAEYGGLGGGRAAGSPPRWARSGGGPGTGRSLPAPP